MENWEFILEEKANLLFRDLNPSLSANYSCGLSCGYVLWFPLASD